MPDMHSHLDGPGESVTDHAANAAFDAINADLTEAGIDAQTCYALVMVMVPDGSPVNCTVAANMPGKPSAQKMLSHALTQLQPVAAECGCTIQLQTQSN